MTGGAQGRAGPNFMGLASLGLDVGIFCDSRYNVLLFSVVLGARFLTARPVAAAGALADGEPPAAGMIGLLARIQAGVWSWHQARADARSTRCPRPPEAVKRP